MVASTLLGLGSVLVSTATGQAPTGDLSRRGFLGAVVRPPSAAERDNLGPKNDGAVVVDGILPTSPAATRGVLVGDTLVSIDGERITGASQFLEAISRRRPGTAFSVDYLREGRPATIRLELSPIPLETSDRHRVIYGSVVSRDERLRTIVTRPNDDSKHPALFLIQGLGSFSIENLPGRPGPYARIVDEFARLGFVTMRVDKPGQGDSQGGPTRDMDFETELDGYRQALKALKGFEFVDPDNVIIFGHSMGGVMGPILGAEIPVKGIAVYGTVARTWHEYTQENVRRQSALAGSSFAEIDQILKKSAALDHFIDEGLSPSEVVERHPDLKERVDDRYSERKYHAATHHEYFRQLSSRNLAEAWEKYAGRTLAVWGKADFISGEVDHALIARIVNRAHPGHGVFLAIEGIDHGFYRAASQEDSFANFGKPGRVYNPDFLTAVSDWASKIVRE